jgi:hypothetical protein
MNNELDADPNPAAGNDINLRLWTLDESAPRPASPWRYPAR